MPITFTRCVYLASATRDFSPQHSNRDYARERSKTKDVFVNTPFNLGMISRFLTDWTGPRGVVRRIRMAMQDNVCAGDDMILTGRVTKKYLVDGEPHVDVEVTIATQDGRLPVHDDGCPAVALLSVVVCRDCVRSSDSAASPRSPIVFSL